MDVVDEIVHIKRDSTGQPLQPISLDVNIIRIKEDALEKLHSDFK